MEIAPAAELAPEHRELAEIAAETEESERPDVAEVLPVDRFRELLDLVPDDARRGHRRRGGASARPSRLLGGRDHELPRRGRASPVREARGARRGAGRARAAPAVEHLPGPAARVPRPVGRHRRALPARRRARAREARAVGLPHVRGVVAPRRGRARPAQHGPDAGRLPRREAGARGPVAHVRPREPARRLHRASAEARRAARAPPAPPPPHRAPGRTGRDRLLHRPPRRLARRARGPRHRALHRLRDEDGGRRDARLPRARVPRRRPRLRAERPAPQDQPLRGRRRRRPAALEARRQAVGADEAEGPPRRSGARRRADQPVRRAQAPRGPRLPARQRVAARVRGPLPVPRDARPARGHRGRPRRHGGGAPHGSPDLRRRGLRQDRGGAACGLQGGRGRQAGHVPGADDRARPAALRHLPGAPARLPVPHRDGVALPLSQGRARVAGGLPRGEGRHPDRHAPRALARRAPEGAGPPDRGRGAALRREAEGAAPPAQAEGGRAVAVGHADPAHASDVAGRPARHLGDRDAARGPPAGQDVRGRLRRRPRGEGDPARAGPRRPGLLPAQPRGDDRRDGRARPGARARRARAGRPRPDGGGQARAGDARLPARRTPTCSCAPRSSSPASTSRARTR